MVNIYKKSVLRKAKFSLAFLFLGVLVSCAGVPVISREETSLADVVAVIRLSPQWYHIGRGHTDGYVLLADAEGQTVALNVSAMNIGQLVWANDGVFVGGLEDEYLLADNGVISYPRDSREDYEITRFITPDGDGFISVYNVGFAEDYYRGKITTGDSAGIISWEVSGMFDSISQCDDRIVGITDIADTRSNLTTTTPLTDVLVQLYPEPAVGSEVLASFPVRKGNIISEAFNAPCVNGTVYLISMRYPDSSTSYNPTPMLRTWNIDTGEHKLIPLLTEKGAQLDMTNIANNPFQRSGKIIANKLIWVNSVGQVFSTDTNTGITTKKFQTFLSAPKSGTAQFTITDASVFVLDIPQDIREPLDLSRYDLETGERTVLMSIPARPLRHSLDMIVRSFVINPEWIKQLESR